MVERGTKLEVTVEKLVYGGEGLSRLRSQTIFTPYVLPGEQVEVEVERSNPGIVRTRLGLVVQPSPQRIAPLCPYFTRCGGCHYQHAPYEFQLQAKRDILAEALRRIGKFEPPEEIGIVSGDPWYYRNRTLFHVEGSRIGYLEARTHVLCPVETCPISSPAINRVLSALLGMARDPNRWPNFLRTIQIFTNETEMALRVEGDRPVARRFFDWCGELIPELVSDPLRYPVDGVPYWVSSQSFFQANRYLIGKLVETALEGAEGDRALDLYAGVGLFSIPLARRFREVTAVELGKSAVSDLLGNVEQAGVNVIGVRAETAEYVQQLEHAPDFVLLDPPRAGMGKEVVRRLGELKPRAIAIVSCDPATLARDLAGLLAAGYKLEKLTLVDLFPQTFHVETVARLVRV